MDKPVDKRQEEVSLGQLFSDLSKQTGELVRSEVQLAKTEMMTNISSLGKDVGFMAIGGFVLYAGFLGIMAAIIVLLAQVIPAWLAALIVGVVVAVIGYFLVQRGLDSLKQKNLAPKQTIQTIKEDVEWAKKQTQ